MLERVEQLAAEAAREVRFADAIFARQFMLRHVEGPEQHVQNAKVGSKFFDTPRSAAV